MYWNDEDVNDRDSNYTGTISEAPNDLYIEPNLQSNGHLLVGSPLINGGDPRPWYNNYDGTRGTLGFFGGPYSTGVR